MGFKNITRNMSLKLFSLLVAILLFLFVSVESVTPVDVDFRLHYWLDDDIMMTGDYPTKITATLQGPWAAFRTFVADDMSPVVIDLKGLSQGTIRHRIEARNIAPPGGMRIVSVRPSEIELNLDRKIKKQVPVSHILGPERPAFGYEILEVRFDPPDVEVAGPLSAMSTLDFVFTRPLDVGGLKTPLVTEVELKPPPPPLKLLTHRVKVTVDIGEQIVTRTFSDVVVQAKNLPKSAKVRIVPEKVRITLRGPRRIVDSMKRRSLSGEIDVLPELEEGAKNFEKTVELLGKPDRTTMTGFAPKVVVQVIRRGARRKQ
ncbi:hypothetical protein KAI87_06305 [Myxococcota bacterium]|nr:hypothetical protein [Myxococcota bacterium]